MQAKVDPAVSMGSPNGEDLGGTKTGRGWNVAGTANAAYWTENEVPQLQVFCALGLSITNPDCISDSL